MNIFPFILKPCLVSFYVYKTNEARIRLKGCWMGGEKGVEWVGGVLSLYN